MDQRPWYQKKKFDPTFPFLLTDDIMHGFSFHWHEFLEIVYIQKGRVDVFVDGQFYTAKKRDIIIISSNHIHGFSGAELYTNTIIFQFGFDFFDQVLPDIRDRGSQKLIFDKQAYFSAGNAGGVHHRLEKLLLAIKKEYFNKEEGYHLAIKAGLLEIARILLREIPAKTESSADKARRGYNHQKLERIFTYIYENFDQFSITLDQVAEVAALSKFYFSRFFKEQTGQTFHAYLNKVRIGRAEEYLAESDIPITDIAYLCGFSSIQTFNRLFKIYMGVSPSCYRFGKKKN